MTAPTLIWTLLILTIAYVIDHAIVPVNINEELLYLLLAILVAFAKIGEEYTKKAAIDERPWWMRVLY